MTSSDSLARTPTPLEGAPRRLLVYVVYDPRGDVEDYIPYALEHLRPHCSHVLVVVNGELTEEGRRKLTAVSDDLIVRENRGYDIWGYKTGLDHVGDGIGDFDEVLLLNDTWFGPIHSFGPVFEKMDARAVHFWGMTDHDRVSPNPFTGSGYLAYHLQSYWVAVRRDMFLSEEWRRYWAELPEMASYSDAVAKHEGVFTEYFSDHGFAHAVAFRMSTEPANQTVLYAEQLLDLGCPILKRRPFFQWPPFLDRLAVIGRWTLEAAARAGYPIDLIMRDLARNTEPRVLNADAQLLEVLPPTPGGYDDEHPLRIVVIAHIFYADLTEEMLDRADHLPGAYDLVITTADQDRADAIREVLAGREVRGAVQIRVVASNNGRDQGAFLIDCRDVLLEGGYDLVVKIHSKRTPQDAASIGRHFRRQQFGNLLGGPHEAARIVGLFQREAGLGIAFPPMIHIGQPSRGHGWWANRAGVEELCARLGIRVPLDEVSPLAPYGSMFFARPEALRLLTEHAWRADDFGGAEAYLDGGLAHVLERMPAYAAGELGYHVRTVATPDYLSLSYTTLEFNLDQMSVTMPGDTMDKIQLLRRAGTIGDARFRDFVMMWTRTHRPHDVARVDAMFERTSTLRRRLWNARHPRAWLAARRASRRH
jgi:lipopolysaccharide biosynthesis protein